jgi:hypothetical protein
MRATVGTLAIKAFPRISPADCAIEPASPLDKDRPKARNAPAMWPLPRIAPITRSPARQAMTLPETKQPW